MDGRQRFWSPRVREIVPYVPGEQPRIANLVKLNTNENPYPPSPLVIERITAAAQQGLQLYPDPQSTVLRQAIARHHAIDQDFALKHLGVLIVDRVLFHHAIDEFTELMTNHRSTPAQLYFAPVCSCCGNTMTRHPPAGG